MATIYTIFSHLLITRNRRYFSKFDDIFFFKIWRYFSKFDDIFKLVFIIERYIRYFHTCLYKNIVKFWKYRQILKMKILINIVFPNNSHFCTIMTLLPFYFDVMNALSGWMSVVCLIHDLDSFYSTCWVSIFWWVFTWMNLRVVETMFVHGDVIILNK